MKIDLPDQTIRNVAAVVPPGGGEAAIAAYVDEAVRQRLLAETIREVRQRNQDLGAEEIARLVDEEVEAVRAARRKAGRGANHS